MNKTELLQKLIDTEIQKQNTYSLLLGAQSKDKKVDFRGAGGDANAHSPYFIASASKLYTLATILQLVDEGRLNLDTPINSYLPADLLAGIHIYKGMDYSQQLKVHQLLQHSSGLADYFSDKAKNADSWMDGFKQSIDRQYTLKDVLAYTRTLSPKFAPSANSGKKSHYSDTNYQLLGTIIEVITGKSQQEAFQERIFDRLGLSQTYLYDCDNLKNGLQPLPFYFKDHTMQVPNVMTSEKSAGGIVSTLDDSLIFLRAFWDGDLFNSAHFPRMMSQWNTVFFPIQYSLGVMRFQLPRIFTLFRYSPELLGHSGASGAFMFYAPKEEVYLVGTLNQVDKPNRPFMLMLNAINALK